MNMININAPSFEFQQQQASNLSTQARPFQGFSAQAQPVAQQHSFGGGYGGNQGFCPTGQKSERNCDFSQQSFLTPQRQGPQPRMQLNNGQHFGDFNANMQHGAVFSAQSKPYYQPRHSTDTIINQRPFQQMSNSKGQTNLTKQSQKSLYDFSKQPHEMTSDQGTSDISTRYSNSSDSDESATEEHNHVIVPAIAKAQSVNTNFHRCSTTSHHAQQQQAVQLQSHQSAPQQPAALCRQQTSICGHHHQHQHKAPVDAASTEGEGEWKNKIKTELCKYWLKGQPCENLAKDQGCGFAHGEAELMPKKGLNKQYLTSVCKNFIDSPEKCTYGHRCIFQHPTLDVYQRQSYRDMMEDNVRYTAMRMFQNIEGAETLYINTYALKTPRLSIFKQITQGAKRDAADAE